MPRLAQIDANLLVALDVLLEERQVTRAARRLGVSQSAMSQTLQRLRDALDDPLLVRSGRRMVPTPRAVELQPQLHAAIQALDRLVSESPGFSPADDARRFRVTCTDNYTFSIVSRLIAALARTGRHLSLEVLPYDADTVWEQLRAGDVELAMFLPRDGVPNDMLAKPCLRDSMVSMARHDHPIFDTPITAESYASWPHVTFRLTGRGDTPVDRGLEALGVRDRRVVGRVPYFLAAPSLALHADVLVTVPASSGLEFARHWPIELFEPPVGSMAFTISMMWPRHLDAEPGHRWLRAQVLEVCQQLQAALD